MAPDPQAPGATPPISLMVQAHVATVTLQAPPVNALTRAMRVRLVEIFDEISDRKDVRVAVLRSACRVFCAGADLRDRPDPGVHGAFPAANRQTRALFNAIRECAKPVIAAVGGSAIGAGFGIAGACDILVTTDDAQFSMTEIKVGLAGGASFLQDLLPRSTARRLIFTGGTITGRELGRMGVAEAVAADRLDDTVAALAREIASRSPSAMRIAKRSCNFSESMPAGEAYKLEQHYTVELASSPDGLEARRAFLEKREPVFREA